MSLDAEVEPALPNAAPLARGLDAGQPANPHEASVIPLDLPAMAKRRGLKSMLAAAFGYGRVRLCFGLLFGIVLPALIHWGHSLLANVSPLDEASVVTLLGAAATMFLGFLALRQIRSFPGVNSGAYVVWVFAAAYGAFVMVLVFGRIEYSRYQLLACFVLTVAWFLVMHYAVVRNRPMRLAVVPSPGAQSLPRMKYVAWTQLREPRLTHAADGVVADLKADHPPRWQAFLTHCALQGLPIFDVKQVTESLTVRHGSRLSAFVGAINRRSTRVVPLKNV